MNRRYQNLYSNESWFFLCTIKIWIFFNFFFVFESKALCWNKQKHFKTFFSQFSPSIVSGKLLCNLLSLIFLTDRQCSFANKKLLIVFSSLKLHFDLCISKDQIEILFCYNIQVFETTEKRRKLENNISRGETFLKLSLSSISHQFDFPIVLISKMIVANLNFNLNMTEIHNSESCLENWHCGNLRKIPAGNLRF